MKVGKLIITILAVGFLFLLYQLLLPTLSLSYLDGALFIAFCIFVLSALVALWISGDNLYDYNPSIPCITFVILFVIIIAGLVIGSSLFNASTKYAQIGTFEEKSFIDDIIEIDNSQIPTVDIELAEKLADKKLGEDIGLGSQMQVGEFTNKQSVNGKLVYVAPLEYRGFFKWNSNKQGTAGYIIVSATNSNDVQLVTQLDGKDIKLKYLNSAYFSSDLRRHIRNQGFRSIGLTEYSFELDDNGYPYYVVTTYENTTTWGAPEATGVVICDVQTGECKWYSINDTPDWVDIIQPESFIKNQLSNYGTLVHGFFNFSEKDELSVTEHITTVYNNGNCYYYTGLSSVGKDEGTVGFVMIDTRTKSAIMYKMVGATEEAAMRSAEGKVQNMGYKATCPIPLNISGTSTYFLTLKDNEGLVKAYALVNIQDYSIVATGATIAETKREYTNLLTSIGNNVVFSDEAYGYTIEGKVTRITANIEGGDSYYYMVLDNDMTKLYIASFMVSEELPVTREGDKVKISYVDDLNGTISIVTFDNLNITPKISTEQEEKNNSTINIIDDPDNSIIEVDPEKNSNTWDSLSEEEKAKLLEDLEENED